MSSTGEFEGAAVLEGFPNTWKRVMTDPRGFEATFRVVAYAAAPMVLSWLPWRLGVLAVLYGAYLTIIGLERVHAFDATRAVLTVVIGLGATWLLFAARRRGPFLP